MRADEHDLPQSMRSRRATCTVVVLAAGLFASSPVFAYIDPGTGSIILQGLLASIAVALGVVRAYWTRVKAFFSSTVVPADGKHDIQGVERKDAGIDSDT